MRIVIEIDPGGTGDAAGSQAPTVNVKTVDELASATSAPSPMGNDAGMAATLSPDAVPAAPPEPLALAASLNAQNAGPAPGLLSPAPIVRSLVTEADTPQTCSREAMHEGGITNAGPAPT
jgi:hypothetical protein